MDITAPSPRLLARVPDMHKRSWKPGICQLAMNIISNNEEAVFHTRLCIWCRESDAGQPQVPFIAQARLCWSSWEDCASWKGNMKLFKYFRITRPVTSWLKTVKNSRRNRWTTDVDKVKDSRPISNKYCHHSIKRAGATSLKILPINEEKKLKCRSASQKTSGACSLDEKPVFKLQGAIYGSRLLLHLFITAYSSS